MQSFLLHEFPHNLLGDSGADSAEAVPDPSVALAPIALVEGFDYLFFNLRIFIRSCLSVSLVEIRTLRKFQNFQEIIELKGFSQDVNHHRFFAIAQGFWIAVLVFFFRFLQPLQARPFAVEVCEFVFAVARTLEQGL